jgi:hypothetical protein
MRVSRSVSSVLPLWNRQWNRPFWLCLVLKRQEWVYLFACILLSSGLLASCSGLNLPGSPAATGGSTSTQSSVALEKLHWCGKPLMIFRDEGAVVTVTPTGGTKPTATETATAASTPATITDWAQVEPNLGFTVYLPPALPAASCLTSASGTIHDPILGGSFTIGYLLPDHSSVSLSEAPLRLQDTTFQCTLSPGSGGPSRGSNSGRGMPTGTPGRVEAVMQICTGARDTTHIVFSALGTMQSLQQFFNSLRPHIGWIPTS